MYRGVVTAARALGLCLAVAAACGGVRAGAAEETKFEDFLSSSAAAAAGGDTDTFSPFHGLGPFEVEKEVTQIDYDGATSTVYMYTPEAEGTSANESWPGVVFGHGFCSKVENYENILPILASWGFVVLATDEMSHCDATTFRNGNTVNTTEYKNELKRNVLFLSEQPNVESVAIAGHSMGGGAGINAAADLAASSPGLVKGVVAVAPWNGVVPHPSAMVANVDCPLLMFCSKNDSLVPCSGPVTLQIELGSFSMPFSALLPALYGHEQGIDWGGGVLGIFENISTANPTVLAVVKDTDHVSILDTDGTKARKMQEYFAQFGMEFSSPDLEYTIPTLEYTVAFLLWALKGDNAADELIWGSEGGITTDDRFLQPVSRVNF